MYSISNDDSFHTNRDTSADFESEYHFWNDANLRIQAFGNWTLFLFQSKAGIMVDHQYNIDDDEDDEKWTIQNLKAAIYFELELKIGFVANICVPDWYGNNLYLGWRWNRRVWHLRGWIADDEVTLSRVADSSRELPGTIQLLCKQFK